MTTANDLKAAVDAAWIDIQRMQTDLGDRNRTRPDGSRLVGEEYWTWRRRASDALRHHLEDYRRLKEQWKAAIRSEDLHRHANAAAVVDPEDSVALLRALYEVTKHVLTQYGYAVVSDQEQELLDTVRAHLQMMRR